MKPACFAFCRRRLRRPATRVGTSPSSWPASPKRLKSTRDAEGCSPARTAGSDNHKDREKRGQTAKTQEFGKHQRHRDCAREMVQDAPTAVGSARACNASLGRNPCSEAAQVGKARRSGRNSSYFTLSRSAPSKRIVVPLSIAFSTIWCGQNGKFARRWPSRGGKGTCARQRLLLRLRHAGHHRRFEHARRDRHHANAEAGQLAGDRQRHRHDAAFGGRVGRLADSDLRRPPPRPC